MSIEKVSSAVEIVLPPGVFMTTIPRCVAVSTSTLSTPTPARPTTRSRSAASMTLRVTFVSDRTTIAAASRTSGNSSASESRFSSTVTLNSDRCCNRAIPFGETGSQINTFINRGRTLVWCLRNSHTFVALELAWGEARGREFSETPHYQDKAEGGSNPQNSAATPRTCIGTMNPFVLGLVVVPVLEAEPSDRGGGRER